MLQRQPEAATWAVYADLLQSAGDSRGELIAMDLQLEREGRSPALSKRRNEALFSWLGGTSLGGRRWNPSRFRFGLFDDSGARFSENGNDSYLEALLRSPVADWLSGLRVQSANLGPRQFELLTARALPWLRRLELDRFWSHRPRHDWWDRLWACAPNLEALTVGRHSDFQAPTLHHPTLRTLTVLDEGVALYNSSLPALRTLRVSGRARLLDVFRSAPPIERVELLGRCQLFDVDRFSEAGRAKVTSVWLDARFNEGGRLRQVLEAFPNAGVEYAGATEPTGHSRVTVTPQRQWPSLEQLSREGRTEESLRFGRKQPLFVSLEDFVHAMEWEFDRLDAFVQTTWAQFWEGVANLPPGARFDLDTERFVEAIEALDDVRFTGRLGFEGDLTESWAAFASKLRERAAGSVSISWDG